MVGIIINYSPREFVSFDPLFDSNESSSELPWTVDDKSSIVEPRLPVVPILEDVVTPVRLHSSKNRLLSLRWFAIKFTLYEIYIYICTYTYIYTHRTWVCFLDCCSPLISNHWIPRVRRDRAESYVFDVSLDWFLPRLLRFAFWVFSL